MFKKIIPLSLLYFAGAVLTVNTFLGRVLYFNAIHRVIYIPLAFWALTALYAYIFGRMIEKRCMNIAFMLTLGLPLHLVLLLLNSYFFVALPSPVMSPIYKAYIELALYAFVFLLLFWGVRVFKESILLKRREGSSAFTAIVFLPLFYVFFYAAYLAFSLKSTRSICAFAFIALSAFTINLNERFYALFLNIFTKIKSALSVKRNIWLAIFIAAFLARLLYGVNTIRQTGETFPTASDDGVTYDKQGYAISKDASYILSSNFLPDTFDVGYSIILGIIYKIFGRSFYIVVLLQSILGATVPLLIYRLCELVFARKQIALLAAIWCSLDQALVMLSSVLGQEAFYIPMLTCLILLITKHSLERENSRVSVVRCVTMGALLGVSAVIRTAIIVFFPVFVIYLFFLKNKKRVSIKLVDATLIIFTAVLMISPITYINYRNSGKFILLTQTKPILDWNKDPGAGELFPSNIALAKIGINPIVDFKGSIPNIINKPRAFLSISADLLFRKSRNFFFCYTFGYFDPVYMINPAKIANIFASNLEFYLFLTVLAGFIMIARNKELRKKSWPMLLIVFYYAFLHIVPARMGNIRYRGPVNPYFIIFGAFAISLLLDYIRRKRILE